MTTIFFNAIIGIEKFISNNFGWHFFHQWSEKIQRQNLLNSFTMVTLHPSFQDKTF